MHEGRGEDVIIALVGNKVDLASERVVSSNDGVEKAKQHNVMFVETSAATRVGIKDLFDNLLQVIKGDDEGATQTDNNYNGERADANANAGGTTLNRQNVEEKQTKDKKKCCGK